SVNNRWNLIQSLFDHLLANLGTINLNVLEKDVQLIRGHLRRSAQQSCCNFKRCRQGLIVERYTVFLLCLIQNVSAVLDGVDHLDENAGPGLDAHMHGWTSRASAV